MKITPEIKAAIEKEIARHGNVSQFAKAAGISHSTVLFWLSGKTPTISGKVWASKLRPLLEPWANANEVSEADRTARAAAAMIIEGVQLIVKAELAKAARGIS